jgi:hypothetical protein
VIEGNARERFVHLVHLSFTQLHVVGRSREAVPDCEKPRSTKLGRDLLQHRFKIRRIGYARNQARERYFASPALALAAVMP